MRRPSPTTCATCRLRTFSTLKRLHDESEVGKKHAEELRKGDVTRAAAPFYLGEDVVIRDTELSPDARWLLVVTTPKSAAKGFEGKLTRYVTESGYEEFETERLRVGRNPPAPQSLVLLNLADHTVHALAVDNLPGIDDDPLKAIREENGTHETAADAAGARASKPRRRGVLARIGRSRMPRRRRNRLERATARRSPSNFCPIDNKDRWIVSVDFAKYALVPQHRLSDPAWVELVVQRYGLAQGQPHALVRVRADRVRAFVYEGAERRRASADAGPIRGFRSRAVGRTAAGSMY